MSTMVVELYEALKDAGASEEKAKAAAVAMANFDSRFNHIDAVFSSMDNRFSRIITDLKMTQLHQCLSLIGIVALVLKAFWTH